MLLELPLRLTQITEQIEIIFKILYERISQFCDIEFVAI